MSATTGRTTWVRAVGALFLAFVAFLLLRGAVGVAPGAVLAVALGVVAYVWLPMLVLSRLVWTLPLFVLLLFATVQMMFHVPGSPFASEKNTSPEVMAEQEKQYGIPEKGFVGGTVFFGRYLKNLVVDGYLGPSIKSQGHSVLEVLLPALPVSLTLGLLSLTIACALGLALGIRAGLRPSSLGDTGSMAFALVGVSLPSFVIGALLLLVFGLGLPFGWLPVAGWGTYGHLVLPAVALALPYAAYIARLARAGTIDVMSEDFIRTARAKGLSERAVVWKHALKGAILPVVSFLGPAAAGILTGSFVVETLFGVPGIGRWFVNGAINRDYYVVLGTVFIECGIVIVFNLLVDMAYAWLDPRTRSHA
jgi:oligopeptide transport system permease protein